MIEEETKSCDKNIVGNNDNDNDNNNSNDQTVMSVS